MSVIQTLRDPSWVNGPPSPKRPWRCPTCDEDWDGEPELELCGTCRATLCLMCEPRRCYFKGCGKYFCKKHLVVLNDGRYCREHALVEVERLRELVEEYLADAERIEEWLKDGGTQ